MAISQKEEVLKHLKKNKTITSWEAIHTYRCTRLADRIFVLRQEGHQIITNNMINEKNGKRYAEYVLIKESENVR